MGGFVSESLDTLLWFTDYKHINLKVYFLPSLPTVFLINFIISTFIKVQTTFNIWVSKFVELLGIRLICVWGFLVTFYAVII